MSENNREELLAIVYGLRSWAKDAKEPATVFPWPRGQMVPAPLTLVRPASLAQQTLGFFDEEKETTPRFKPDPVLEKHGDLESLNAAIKDCVKCPLGRVRQHFVFGEGNPHAKLMFVGEAPGRDEDIQGRPFVGRAGQLLTKIVEAMGLRRQDVYIANILKCRPPNNRAPQPEEIEACWPHLAAQIHLIRPKVLCALGSYASKAILQTDLPIGALRGRFHDVDGIPVMPTYHPAYLLRNPNDKGKVWEDVKKIRDLLKTL